MRSVGMFAALKLRLLGIFLSALLLLLCARQGNAQTHWAFTLGGANNEAAYVAEPTSDGGTIVGGASNSFSPSGGWLFKLAADGSIQWQKVYGGNSGFDGLQSVQQTSDGGYVAAGRAESFGAGAVDFWIVKLASDGSVQWTKTFGGSGSESASSIRQTSDSGYIVAGTTSSFGAGQNDIWILKLDSTGNIQWQRAYGFSGFEIATSIQQTFDSGYIVAGFTSLGPGVWVVKLSSTGDVQWQRVFGGSTVSEIRQTNDGGYVFAASRFGANGNDSWLVKLNVDGAIQWQESFNDPGEDGLLSVQQTSDGGYIAGARTSISGDIKSRIYKLDSNGAILWQKILGEPGDLYLLYSIREASDGGYIAAAETRSFGTNGPSDALIIKTDSTGTVETFCSYIRDDVLFTVATSAIPTDTNALVNVTNATISSGGSVADTTAVPVGHCINPSCIYCYAFDQNPLPPSDWTYVQPSWAINGGNLEGTPVGKKASALAIPAFGGCSRCSVRTSMSTQGGLQNKVWLLGWYADKQNAVEVLMKQENNKFILRQRSNGVVVGKTKGVAAIVPGQFYDVKVAFDGAVFTLIVDGNTLATLPAAVPPLGTVGFQVKGTTASFRFIHVEQ